MALSGDTTKENINLMPHIPLLSDKSKKRRKFTPKPRNPNSDKKRKQRQSVYQSTRYIKLREQKRMECPTCEICQMFGIVNWGEHVHHWLTFVVDDPEESKRRAYDYTNLVTLCRKHHDMLHTGLLKGCYSFADVKDKVEQMKKELGIDISDPRKL